MSGAWPPMPPSVGPVDPDIVAAAAAELEGRCPGRVSRGLPLAPLTTFRLGGPAAVFLRAETLDDLAALADVLAAAPVPLLVVGRGSNMLVADGGWPGIVLHLGQRLRRVEVEGTELEAGAATPLPSLAARSAKASLGGIAFAVAIPGQPPAATSMFDPRPTTSSGTGVAASTSARAARSSRVSARRNTAAGPPSRKVVSGARDSPRLTRPGQRASSSAAAAARTSGSTGPTGDGIGGHRSTGGPPRPPVMGLRPPLPRLECRAVGRARRPGW